MAAQKHQNGRYRHDAYGDESRGIAREDRGHVAENVTEECGDHTEEHGVIEDLAPTRVLLFHAFQPFLNPLGAKGNEKQSGSDSNSHNPENGDVIGCACELLTGSKTELIDGGLRGDGFIAE